MIDWVGAALVGVGGGLLALSEVAQRYHSREFADHFERVSRLADDDDHAEVSNEIRRFHNDRRVVYAEHLMTFGYPLGMLVVFAGAVLLLT